MTDLSQFTVAVKGFAASSPLIDTWTWSTDPPAGEGCWFAVLLSYEIDGISPDAMVFARGRAVTFRVGNLIAYAGPFPDQTTAAAWASAHDPDWLD